MTRSSLEARAAWRAALALTTISMFGAAAALVLWRSFGHGVVKLWPWWIVFGVAGASAWALWSARAWPRVVGLSRGLSMAVIATVFNAAWHTNDALARAHVQFQPFEAFKLAALTIALVGPTHSLIGFTCLFASGVVAGLRYALWPAWVRTALPPFEPFTTFVYTGIAAGMYAYRIRTFRLERRAYQAEAEAAARLRAARTLVAAGDLLNSPLQTIELTVSLLRAERGPARIVGRIERSVERLRHVSRLVERYAELAHWEREDLSLDAFAVLEEQVQDRERQAEPTK